MALPRILNEASVNSIVGQTDMPSSFYFANRFGSINYPEDLLRWLVFHKDKGMAPIIDRGAQSPLFKGNGVSEMYARGALISEKISHTEEDINRTITNDSMRRQAAEHAIMTKVESLIYRVRMRQEWLASQIFFQGGAISYNDKYGTSFSIDFNLPSSQKITDLGANNEWLTGTSRDPMQDVYDMKERIKLNCGSPVTNVFINSTTLRSKLVADTTIQGLLEVQKHNVGGRPLFADPLGTISWLFNTPFTIYDETMPVTVNIITRTDASNYIVDDITALTAGTRIVFARVDENNVQQEEEATIDSITTATSTITTSSAVTGVFYGGRDVIQAQVPFLPDDRVVFAAETVGGQDIMEWYNAPMGMGAARYGLQTKTWENEDPDQVFTRAQLLGLWALKQSNAIGYIDVD